MRRRLVDAGEAEIIMEVVLGRPQHRLVPLRPSDVSVLSTDERQSIDDVLDQLAGRSPAVGPPP